MRWKTILGMLLCVLALTIGLVSIAVPNDSSQSTKFTTAEGIEGIITTDIPSQGWSGDWSRVTLTVTTVNKNASNEPLTLRARLEPVDAETQPSGDLTSIILPGESTSFAWKLRSQKPAAVNAILWVYAGGSSGVEQLLYAHEFIYRSLSFASITPAAARVAGVFILIIGVLILAIPIGGKSKK